MVYYIIIFGACVNQKFLLPRPEIPGFTTLKILTTLKFKRRAIQEKIKTSTLIRKGICLPG